MSYLVLARKYRPQTFDEVVKQDHITRTLTNAISADRVAHAILFSGPRGTGKTTVGRILAKAMNCKDGPVPVPCNRCSSCKEITAGNAADVFEIDGASNNSVDQIRELRGNVKYMPAHSLYKIYIIDEVHMLSIAAFNALLKTLEEPPSHVMFIFATTEPRKIPITILSRCQRHDFRRIDVESIVEHMEKICKKEEVEIDPKSLGVIAREANGSMRDGLSLLDQVMSCTQGKITHDQVLDILGVVDREIIFKISDALFREDIAEILDIVDTVFNAGHDMKKLYADLIEHFRNLLIINMGEKNRKLVDIPANELDLILNQVKKVPTIFLNQIFDLLFKEEMVIDRSSNPRLAMETVFIRIFQTKPALPIDVLIEKLDNLRRDIHETSTDGVDPGKRSTSLAEQNDTPLTSRSTTGATGTLDTVVPPPEQPANRDGNVKKIWERLLSIISEEHPALAANLKNSMIKKLAENRIEIEVNGSHFNINMILKNKNEGIIKKVCSDFFGKKMDVVIVPKTIQDPGHQKKKCQAGRLKQEALSHPLLTDALEIFSGNVVDVKIL